MDNFARRAAASFVLAACALAASADTLYNNLAQATFSVPNPDPFTGLVTATTWQGSRFATAASAESLANVVVAGAGQGGLSLSLYSDAANVPSTLVGALGASSDLGGGLFSFAGRGLALAANTRYWIVASNPTANSQWFYTSSDGNAGSSPTLSNGVASSTNSGSTWLGGTGAGVFPFKMSVTANPVPEPAPLAALSLGVLAMLRRRKRS